MEAELKKRGILFPPPRQYISIELDNNQETNKIKLTFSAIRIQEMITQNDTVNGIHYHFTDHCTYKNFLCVLNVLCQMHRVQWHMHDGTDIWVFQQSPYYYSSFVMYPDFYP
ncbi:hypothetical protein SAMN05421788_109211 [Filimonas lacunae]|uniref:Uncharacterized protein n=1 Tax=Filimonas lacunae TaxID=477680 RepID=A0A173MII5_9BACT|nr:hypothetical protein FLA_3459 [Filimonas lacunae]SIT30386.1 hypothetical protein SAMN05421788_109211 [Filimonas lacunae]